MTDDLRMLAQQLDEAWADWTRGEGDAFEIAALAGLLDRAGTDEPGIQRARERLADLQRAVDDIDLDATIDRLTDLDEDSEPEVLDGVLFDLDEIGAAASFLGRTSLVTDAIELAVSTIRGFPEVFGKRSALASEILAHRAPRPEDPALALWRAVEIAAISRDGAIPAVVPTSALRRLGLPVLVSVRAVLDEPQRLAASDLAPEPGWTRIAEGDDWEIALTARDGHVQVVVATPAGVTPSALRDGVAVKLHAEPSGLFTGLAVTGDWAVRIGNETATFAIEP